jgi:F0F1-type ATP synthase assembly protein I
VIADSTYTLGAFFMDDKPTSVNPKIGQWEAVGFVWELLIIIAVPTVLCALAGRWIDHQYGITPWGTVIGLILAVALSAVLVMKSAKKIAERMKSQNRKAQSE